ncbi:MAG: DMT family transporter [Nocardioides sp.]
MPLRHRPRRPVSAASFAPALAVLVTMVLWASAFVAIRHLGRSFSPGSLALGRLAVASGCLGAVAATQGLVRLTRAEWFAVAGIGVLWFGVYNVALNTGELLVDAGTAAMILQVSPLLIALLAAVFLNERFTGLLGAGLLVSFTGVVMIGVTAPDGGGDPVLGAALCVLSAIVYSISVILQKPLTSRIPAIQITWLACTVGMLTCLPFGGQLLHDLRAATTPDVWWVAYLGVFPTAIAFTTYAYALGRMDAGRLGVTTYLVPPITIGMGWAFLSESPAPLAYVGGLLALLGVAIARHRRADRTARPTPTATT